ncbi:mRNA 3'-end-processing protein rna14 [Trichoderma virens FT-333]|nr:mRNA 3'-end-processing protein rna14 [Trichoderma virens FT-333]
MASEGTSWDNEGFAAAEGDHTQHSDEQVDNFAQDSHVSGESAENGTEDGGDYDPEYVPVETVLPDPPVPENAAPAVLSQRPTPKPKMSGGFLVEASDDEDDDQGDNAGPAEPSASQSQVGQPTEIKMAIAPVPPLPTNAPSNVTATPMASLDPVALFEARIKEDPRGDLDAWENLIADHRRNSRLDEVRKVYNRFLEVFPQSADVWVEWIKLELGMDNFVDAEQLFGRCLMTVPNVNLWTVYLNYIRRRNDLNNDPTGQARRTVTQSYEFVIDNIGVDRDSGNIWQDYVQFIKSGPGQIGGTGWQDQQKMDQLRKAYHRAITVPMSTVNNLWKEYDQFEMGLNKVTVAQWKKWIEWEKEDPLVLKTDEPKVFTQRVLYCYKQALMALRFWPELWVDAAEWCLQNDIGDVDKELGTEFLVQGIAANPESVLLALKHADHIEATSPLREGDKSEFAKAVRKPYDDVLNTLYALGDKAKEREKLEISTLKQAAAQEAPVQQSIEDDDYEEGTQKKATAEERISAIQKGYAAETNLLSRTISYVWIAMARAIRRIQGKGNQTDGGLRKVFTDARQKGRLTSDVYVAVALLESVVYKDPVGAKIFERGARLFPNDEGFVVEYLKFLHSKDDTTNARVVFETCVNRLVANPETLHKAKPLYAYFHKYESQYGELSQIHKIEARMLELFPEDPKLTTFAARYSSDKFDPIVAPVIISKAAQMRPKLAAPIIEQPASAQPLRLRNAPLDRMTKRSTLQRDSREAHLRSKVRLVGGWTSSAAISHQLFTEISRSSWAFSLRPIPMTRNGSTHRAWFHCSGIRRFQTMELGRLRLEDSIVLPPQFMDGKLREISQGQSVHMGELRLLLMSTDSRL